MHIAFLRGLANQQSINPPGWCQLEMWMSGGAWLLLFFAAAEGRAGLIWN
jgi:hypothetical protein